MPDQHQLPPVPPLPRYTIKAAGESGQGVNSVGEMLAKALKESGLFSFGYREYPSLIKGGWSSHQIDISDQPIYAPSQFTDLLFCLSRASLKAYLATVRAGGIVLHSLRQMQFSPAEQKLITDRGLHVVYVPTDLMALEVAGKSIMGNTVMVGLVWQLLGLDIAPLQEVLKLEFARKPQVIEPNLKCLDTGYTYQLPAEVQAALGAVPTVKARFQIVPEREADALLTGNHLIAMGAVAAGVRAYYAYPMTPSSSILGYLASVYKETGMLVKQIDDEISVAQMAIGSMFMGTRSLVGTSGGGFDLMTESVSLAGMTETPFVCVIAQRPGPATGLPTWTSAADLNLAVFAGHGEFARCVIAASDPESCYLAVQQAFNIAEEFQTVVIVLTEKQIGESLFQMRDLPADLPIERHLVSPEKCEELVSSDRYQVTESGVSPRWLPGMSDATFDANSDEHLEDGSLTEEAAPSLRMYDKRLRKQAGILAKLPEPVMYGPEDAVVTLVGWGSVKNAVADVMPTWNEQHPDMTINYLHYEYVWPLRTERLQSLISARQRLILVENNATKQLGGLLAQSMGYLFETAWLKYDGRPFFTEDIWVALEGELATRTTV